MPLRAAAARPIRGVALAATLLLASCGGGSSKTAGPGELTFKPIAPDVFTVVIAANADVPKTEAALRKYCDGKPSCIIYGWTDPAAVARSVPLDDSHYATLAVRYVAHAVGTDDMMWDCLRFLKARAPCLPKA